MYTPKEMAENYGKIAQAKVSYNWWKTLLLSFMAGMFIALGGIASISASAGLSGGVASLVKGIVFPVGLAMVLIAGADLFTGNCLLIIGVLDKKIKTTQMLRNLALVLLGNLIGGVTIALLCWGGGLLDKFAETIVAIAVSKTELSFGRALASGILCNILVAIAVWMSFASKTSAGKIVTMYLPILAFVACGFEHIVANFFYIFAGLFAGAKLSFGGIVLHNFLPVLLGNIIGGMVFVGLPYYLIYLTKSKKEKEQNSNDD